MQCRYSTDAVQIQGAVYMQCKCNTGAAQVHTTTQCIIITDTKTNRLSNVV